MNRYNCIQKGILLLAATIALYACDKDKHIKGGEMIEQSATLEVITKDKAELADPYRLRSLEVANPEMEQYTLSLRAHLALPATEETPIAISVDEQAAKKYGKGAVKLLPTSLISIPKEATPIAIQSITSDPITVNIAITDQMEYDEVYTFALRLAPIKGVRLNAPNDVALFTIVRRENKVEIKQAVRLTRDKFFDLAKQFDHQGDFTMECLVNVEKFRNDDDPGEAQISTLMGIEGGTLLRFGDSGLPGNRLQVAGNPFRDFLFGTNTWYHIAMTYQADTQTVTVYFDGKEQASFTKGCSLRPFGNKWYIGRSWSDNRGLQALLSEVRIWKCSRTQAEIEESMLQVDPKNENLLAYWKMNSAEESKVADLTGNGYDLTLKAQKGETATKVNVITLDQPLDSVEK